MFTRYQAKTFLYSMTRLNSLKEEFRKIYKTEPEHIFFAPGKANLIGEHIDYNGGMVLPVAITLGTYLLISHNDEKKFVFRTTNLKDHAEVLVSPHYRPAGIAWINHPLGVIEQFTRAGHPGFSGLNMLFSGDIPLGSGLSSSASIEMVTAYALNELFQCNLAIADLIRLVKAAKKAFIGKHMGVMDPYIIGFGQKDKALALNCLTAEHQIIPCKLNAYSLVIINTHKPHSLADSKYSERFAQCHQAVTILKRETGIEQLCQLSAAQFEEFRHLISDLTLQRRVQHVVEENERVYKAIKALTENDPETLGQLMFDSHLSLRQLYEVTGRELDTAVDLSQQLEGVIGAGMTGTGAGSCVVTLVHKSSLKSFTRDFPREYEKLVGYQPDIYPVKTYDGVKKISNPYPIR